jgi:hypothetical protein
MTVQAESRPWWHTHTHTHTQVYLVEGLNGVRCILKVEVNMLILNRTTATATFNKCRLREHE